MRHKLLFAILLVSASSQAFDLVKPQILVDAEAAIGAPAEVEPDKPKMVTLELVGMAPSPRGPVALLIMGEQWKILPQGESWRGMQVDQIDIANHKATVSVKGETAILNLHGANTIRVFCEWNCGETHNVR